MIFLSSIKIIDKMIENGIIKLSQTEKNLTKYDRIKC